MKQLIETSSPSLAKRSPTCLQGEFATLDELNQNNRIYPHALYEDALKKLLPKVKARSLLGECDHPLDYDEVRLSNVSHIITEVTIKGNKVYGTVELLDTPSGKIAKSLVEAGIPLGISSRSVGDIRESNGHEIVTELNLVTYDLVADPSFKYATLDEVTKGKLKESLETLSRSLPLRESSSVNTVNARKTLTTILESLNSPKQSEDLSILHNKYTTLRESHLDSIHTIKELRETLSKRSNSLRGLTENMHSLQEAYNLLKETTVSKTSYEKLASEVVELRKRLLVESKGMTYSQVRPFLEGATTEVEIKTRLESLPARQAVKGVLTELFSEDSKLLESNKPPRTSRLSEIISRV